MSNTQVTVIPSGTRVRTTGLDHEFYEHLNHEERSKRRWGVDGTIKSHHDGDFPHYEIQHEDDGSIGLYDRSEFK